MICLKEIKQQKITLITTPTVNMLKIYQSTREELLGYILLGE